MAPTEDRPVRGCELCGQVDDHPRVVHPFLVNQDVATDKRDLLIENGLRGNLLDEVLDPTSRVAHHDCCSQAGCPTGVCDQVVAENGGKTGAALLKSITKEG